MRVERGLIAPAIDEQHGLGVVQGEKVGVALVALLGADALDKAAFRHLAGKGAGAALPAGVVQVDGQAHEYSPFLRQNRVKKAAAGDVCGGLCIEPGYLGSWMPSARKVTMTVPLVTTVRSGEPGNMPGTVCAS